MYSAYYNAPVSVRVLKSERRPDRGEAEYSAIKYDRAVDLVVFDRVFCSVEGDIEIFDQECVAAIESRKVGVGQLFRFLGVLPAYRLLSAGRAPGGGIWRDYELSCSKFKCRFKETFSKDLWTLSP